ncbi:MAG: HEAT repeat domain-containing protein [Candidatus Thorarchaeota archaeon]|nr:HEAT repeat domain-containing protein [Candidatus Thorarchaeota archaeon]
MSEEKNRSSILKAAKDRARQSEMQSNIQMITDAIGDRRDRDLLDILSQLEQDTGWPIALEYLLEAKDFCYSLPIGSGPIRTQLEPLKYREMVFSIFSCDGLEPIITPTIELLTPLKDEHSLLDASRKLRNRIEQLAMNQIQSGDTLFFDSSDFGISFSKEFSNTLDQMMNKQIHGLVLEKHNDEIDISPLWQYETGRLTLSKLGIRGKEIDLETANLVLSVIQQPITISNSSTHNSSPLHHPTNPKYRELLDCIIEQNIDGLRSLSSRHSYIILKQLLEEAIDRYAQTSSSLDYRRILNLINAHVRIRTPESIQLLQLLINHKDIRIASVAITALGNFYHESAVYVLVDSLCDTKNMEIVRRTTAAIKTIARRCPETNYVIMQALESACTHKARLRHIQKEIGKQKALY